MSRSRSHPRSPAGRDYRRDHHHGSVPHMHPEADPALKKVFDRIGRPRSRKFAPDAFQRAALEAVQRGDCLVSAPTGSGKTWIALEAIRAVFNAGGRSWYATPLKALSNAKWVEFGEQFGDGNVGILTGDLKENMDAPIVVGTTEILRNQLYDVMDRGADLACDLVVLDEAHYLGDADRGVVWEEVLIYLPSRVHVLLLSATIGNGDEIAAWLSSIRGKDCTVVRETKRPVPLYPLFLHPSGRMLPCLERGKLHHKVRDFMIEGGRHRPRGSHFPRFGEVLRVLRSFDLLPAIFFLKSRSECDGALKSCRQPLEGDPPPAFFDDLEDLLERSPYLRRHRQLYDLEHSRVAAHHGGQLPAWKFLVESMMKKGHLEAIFATSTVAAGVNYPARTIALFNSDLFNGHDFAPLDGTAFHQMTGRAGRRGVDKIGFLVVSPGRFMDLDHIRLRLAGGAEDVNSRIRSDFPMVLNLLLSQTPADVGLILERSFAVFQQKRRGNPQALASLQEDFQRHLSFLRLEGFVDETDRLTENGLWASKLRLDQPLLIAEVIRRDRFPADEKLLAAVTAPFVYDGDEEANTTDKRRAPRRLEQAFRTVARTIRPLKGRLEAAGFPAPSYLSWPALVMYDWARNRDWDEIVHEAGITDGELAMLVLRTADNLRQIRSLGSTHPDLAARAEAAMEVILREPVR